MKAKTVTTVGITTAMLIVAGVVLSGCWGDERMGPPLLNCDSDPVTPLPENFSASKYWELNPDLQIAFPTIDSVELARHYCKYGEEQGRLFGDDPIYSSETQLSSSVKDPLSSDKTGSSAGDKSSGKTESSGKELSSSTKASSSSTGKVDNSCNRTLVKGAYFLMIKDDIEGENPIVRGWIEGGPSKFKIGDWVVSEGSDCDYRLKITDNTNTHNLYTHATWQGAEADSIRLEIVSPKGNEVWDEDEGNSSKEGNSSEVVNSSSKEKSSEKEVSSSSVDNSCNRTLVKNAYFKFVPNAADGDEPWIQGWTDGGVLKFEVGDWVVARGQDCALRLQVTMPHYNFEEESGDTYNLYTNARWKGAVIDSTLIEKVTPKGDEVWE